VRVRGVLREFVLKTCANSGLDAWDSWGPKQDINTVGVINKILDAEPTVDLVVLNGDLITGENAFLENSTAYIDQMVKPMMQRNLTWASTYGNHDNSFNVSHELILAREQTWRNARTRQLVSGDDVGVNYYLPVYDAKCKVEADCTPELLLWFFDSRGGLKYQEEDPQTGKGVGVPCWVDESVVEWFEQTNLDLVNNAGKTIPSLAFVHIPTNASVAFQETGVDANKQPGINDDNPMSGQAQGWCPDETNNETCYYGGQDGPFMEAITSTPGLLAVFSAHDHGDTWCYRWDRQLPGMDIEGNGVNLCFGQRSGYGGYGSWIRGARQIVASKEQLKHSAVDTFVRLESGGVVGSVTLNSTYGKDLYLKTPKNVSHCTTYTY